jgi:DNA excision repair protein ERCC-1
VRSFRLRLVLCHVDVEDMVKALGEVNKTCVQHACTLVCAWSPEEVARYLETFKLYEHKTAEAIQERTENDYTSRLAGALRAWVVV